MTYPKLGLYSIVPAADLTSLTSAANKVSDARTGSNGIGKQAGMFVWRDAGSSAYSLVFALGSTAAAKWRVVDGSAEYTPS